MATMDEMVKPRRAFLAGSASALLALLLTAAVASASAPIKLSFAGDFGRNVNLTEAGKGLEAEDNCLVSSGDTCQAGEESGEAGGYRGPVSVAVDKANGDVYVADQNNNRIEKLGPNGEFLLMWGWEVNKNGTNVCTAAEVNECKAGSPGRAADELRLPESVTVDNTCFEEKLVEPTCKAMDPTNGDVYVLEKSNHRVDRFGPEGEFFLMFGGEVNTANAAAVNEKGSTPSATELEEENICRLGETCQSGTTGTANGFFAIWSPFKGNLMAIGGPDHLLYVADEGRVDEFDDAGAYQTQLTLTTTQPAFPVNGKVTGLAVDGVGDLYLTESYATAINEEEAVPKGVYEFPFGTTTASRGIDVTDERLEGIALDEAEHLAVTDAGSEGTLFDLSETVFANKFTAPSGLSGATGLSFNGEGDLYLSEKSNQDLEKYRPLFGATLVTSAPSCVQGAPHEAFATVDCTLHGEVDAWGVKETEAWFQWGTSNLLGQTTAPKQTIANTQSQEGVEEAQVPVSAQLTGLAPNEAIYDRVAATDHNFPATEPLTSTLASFTTPTVAPRVIGAPEAQYVSPFSADLDGLVNPENTETEYFYEYLAGNQTVSEACPNGVGKESCPNVMRTVGRTVTAYASVGAAIEASQLAPAATYRYRLMAINKAGEAARYISANGSPDSGEGSFTTAPSPGPAAITGSASNVTVSSATVEGSVNANGRASVYHFEVGIDNGAATQFGIVGSGSVDGSNAGTPERAVLSGLEPGVAYAYRISATNAFGATYGLVNTFTTQGLPAMLLAQPVLAQLPVPQCPHYCFEAVAKPAKAPVGESCRAKAKRTRNAKRRKKASRRCVVTRHKGAKHPLRGAKRTVHR